jgi:DNA-binding IclR family transcriptional regulator
MQKKAGLRTPRQRPAYPLASVDRALRLLLLFGRQTSVRLSDASEALGVAPSTAHRLLAMLAFHDFVRRREDGRRGYVPGPAMAAIGRAPIQEADLVHLARPFLEDLAARAGETVHLSVLEGSTVRYIDAVESAHALRVAARTGRSLPAHCTAAGKVLLATLAPDQVERLLGGVRLEPATARSITDLGVLTRLLTQVRRAGHAVNLEESEDGVASVAVPVYDIPGRAMAALSVAGPVTRMDAARRHVLAGEATLAAARLAESLLP